MKFIIHGGTLSRSLNSIVGLISTNNTIPIVENFLFELKDKKLSITASDLETIANVNIDLQDAETTGVDKVCVPAKMFVEIVNKLSNSPITIFVNEDLSIDISTDYGKYTLIGVSPEDYPEILQVEDAQKSVIHASTLVNGITKTIFATSTDEFRPQMAGVLCEFSEKGLTFVGTDSHKLVRLRNMEYASEEQRSFILPKKTLNLMNKILLSLNEEEDVKIENNISNISFIFGDYHIVCRLIEGKYPQYESAIPTDNPNKLIIQTAQLLDSVKRVSIFANPTTNQIRFSLTDKELVIIAEDIDYQNKAKEKLACNYQGDSFEIGLNAKYLIEMLNNIETENVCFEMSRPDRPCIIIPYEEEKQDEKESLLMLVMPVILGAN
ncbi:MAG: DNA polymerase III subunit beta [Bacteroidales bacterium]|jgi:DNA polymerase-3 subunit beta|nr:DNA polymerase III subunit beta [Bacteroidales bacterium]